MKVTRNWLRTYVDFDGSPEELAERLTMLGLEVQRMDPIGGEFAGVVVAEVRTRDKHPNADKLSVCRVHDGKGERQIVCGAQNFKPGDKVALILPGSSLPSKPGQAAPFVIKVGRIRGVESQGMMCSAEELGLDPAPLGLKAEEGLLILKPEALVGQALAQYLGRTEDDVVYTLEITPNRPDLNSVIGIAREIAAVTSNPLRMPKVSDEVTAGMEPAGAGVAVRLEAPDLCPRYTARVVRGVKIGPSPDWLRQVLENIGLRSINNVVDVTNFVMFETGQPLHAFDYHWIARSQTAAGSDDPEDPSPGGGHPSPSASDAARPTLVVRRAADHEKIVTLDGKEHSLSPDDLLIADAEKAIALAGVMGGLNTEIKDQTADVLLESAYFSPTGIRRTSKRHGIRTDSSYRFERGVDPETTDWASRRAVQLILETAGGALAPGVIDAYPEPVAPRSISLRPRKVNELLGLNLQPGEIECLLGQLGLRATNRKPRSVDDSVSAEPLEVRIPSYRSDLKREADLIEEVARLYGVDRIPSTEPRQARGVHPFDAQYDEAMEARRLLAGLGLNETQGQTLISRASVAPADEPDTLALVNPLSSDMDVLRPSLLPGLLDILRHNLRHKNDDVALFEIGRVFRRGTPGGADAEPRRLAVALTGRRQPAFWSGPDRDAPYALADLKGLLDEFFDRLGLRGVVFGRRPEPTALFVESATIALGGKLLLGELGLLQPALGKRHDLRDAVLLAELDLDRVLARRTPLRSFKKLPAYPAIRRDIAMVVADAVTHDAIVQVVRQTKAVHLEVVELFDIFRGEGIPPGHKSVAYALTYRAPDRTLTDAEVSATHEAIVRDLHAKLGASIRG